MKIIRNKFVRSFVRLMVLSAIIHIAVLFVDTIKNKTLKPLNFFSIIGMDNFFPKITNGWISTLISLVLMALLYSLFLIIEIKKE
jgi:phosphatidylserine synthase